MSSVSSDAGLRQGDRFDETALLELGRALKTEGYSFVTVTPSTHQRINARRRGPRGSPLADVFGWSRPFAKSALPARIVDLMESAGVIEKHGVLFRSAVRASSLLGDLFFHSAFPTTAADSVFFGPDTHRFANAVAGALATARPISRAADIGSGAGPGGVLIAKARPEAQVFMADINEAALALSRVNAGMAGVANARAVHSDLFAGLDGDFDLIVANPPYLVDAAQRRYRHGGGQLGADLSLAIVEGARRRLAPGGEIVLYTGAAIVDGEDPFRNAIADLMSDARLIWSYREVDPDVFPEELDHEPYLAADRIAAVVLTARKQG